MGRWDRKDGNRKTSKGMERPFKCPYCKNDYASEDAYKVHVRLCRRRSEKHETTK